MWSNFWDCFHDPRSSSRSKVMVILVIHLQFHFYSAPLLFWRITPHITLCTVTCHHACNMVMIKLHSLLQTFPYATQPHAMATMSALGPAGAWEIASSRIPPFIFKPDEHRSSGSGPANKDYNRIACMICLNRLWLVGDKAIILIGFPLLCMYSWCQSSAVDAS